MSIKSVNPFTLETLKTFEETTDVQVEKAIDAANDAFNEWKKTSDVSLTAEIMKHDVITFLATESTLIQFGWGFIVQAWLVYCTPKGDRIAYYIDKIKNDPAWYDIVKQKAKQFNKDINLQLQQDANYAVEMERK